MISNVIVLVPSLPPSSRPLAFLLCALGSVGRISQLKAQVATLRAATSKHGRALHYYSSLKAVAASRNETSRSHDHLAALTAFTTAMEDANEPLLDERAAP